MVVGFIFILLAVHFRPVTLWDRLSLADIDSDGIVYCTFLDIAQGKRKDWSGTVSELLGQPNEIFGALFHEVSIAGPVFYKNSVINPNLANLYLALPKGNGVYQRNTVELILSHGDTPENYSAFINIDKGGYFVVSGKSTIALFMQKARGVVTEL